MRRLVVPPACIEGRRARLEGSLRHHVVDVLRLQPGAELVLLDGEGRAYHGRLAAVDEAVALVEIDEQHVEPAREAGPLLTLVYGVSRRPRLEWVLQKATELGVDEIHLAECRRSVAHGSSPAKLARWQEIVRQAARQSGRAHLPVLDPPRPLGAVLEPQPAAAGTASIKLIASPGAPPLSSLRDELGRCRDSVVLAVGPEGGFAEDELALAATAGFRPVGLGPLVLRTETAALVLLALAAFLTGRLEGGDPR